MASLGRGGLQIRPIAIDIAITLELWRDLPVVAPGFVSVRGFLDIFLPASGQWTSRLLTVGGQPATVGFNGAASTFVDGVDQLNIQLSANTPTGAQPVVMTIGGVSSPSNVALAVE